MLSAHPFIERRCALTNQLRNRQQSAQFAKCRPYKQINLVFTSPIRCTKYLSLQLVFKNVNRVVLFGPELPAVVKPGEERILCDGTTCTVHPITAHEGPEGEQMYSSTLPSISALDGAGGQHHAPAALPPVKTRNPLHRRLGGPQGRSGRVGKNLSSPAFDPRTVQPVASRYTD